MTTMDKVIFSPILIVLVIIVLILGNLILPPIILGTDKLIRKYLRGKEKKKK